MNSWLRALARPFRGESGAPPVLDRLSSLHPGILLGASCAVFIALSVGEMWDESVTTDELVHLSAGYTYVTRLDYRLNPEHPALVKLLAALPLLAADVRWPGEPEWWTRGLQWQFGYKLLYQSGNSSRKLLLLGRLPMLVWGLLLLGTVYAVTHELFGPTGAFLALVLATFFPLFLGHAHLVTTDVPVATFLLLTAAAFWKLAERPSWARAAGAGFMLGGALAVKYSAIMLVPALLWYLTVKGIRRVLSWRNARRAGSAGPLLPRREAIRLAGFAAVVALLPLLVIWASYRFRFDASTDSAFQFDWSFPETGRSLIGRSIAFARAHHFLPEAYLNGFGFMFENAQGRNAFALGQRSTAGWWWYFPFATLVKTPVAALLLMGWGLVASFRRYKDGTAREDFLIVPLIIFWVLAMSSRMNIGLRHVMPVFPLMIVLAGGIDLSGLQAWRKRAALSLAALAALECLVAAPYFLAYFNAPSVLLADRHAMLTDSNLDWGQDLARLKRWMDRNGIRKIKLAYFGNASPRELGLDHERTHAANMYQSFEPEWRWTEALEPGDLVAVGATNYAGVVLGDRPRLYLDLFEGQKPIATIGHSILIFKVR